MKYTKENLKKVIEHKKKLSRMGIVYLGATINALSGGNLEKYFLDKGYKKLSAKEIAALPKI
jgi:hypothetical protein